MNLDTSTSYTPSNSIAQELLDYQDQQQAKAMHQAYLDAQPKPKPLTVLEIEVQECSWKNPAYGAIEPIVKDPHHDSRKVVHYGSSMPFIAAH